MVGALVENPGESPVDKVSVIICSPEVTVVGKYVDGLHVSVTGEPRPAVFEKLREIRAELWASGHGIREFGSILGVPGESFALKAHGRGQYPFVLENEALYLELTDASRFPETMPKVRIQFRPAVLYEQGLEGAEATVKAISNFFLESDSCHKVSRFDYAADFQYREWQWPESSECITRARNCTTDEEGVRITGKTFGKNGADLQLQIYDKTFEIKKSGKEWMVERWATKEAYDPGLSVIRVEARFNRDFLREFKREDPQTSEECGVDTIANLKATTGDLVRHVVGGDGVNPWFRIASPESRGRKTDRRSAAPWWAKITEAFLEGEPEPDVFASVVPLLFLISDATVACS